MDLVFEFYQISRLAELFMDENFTISCLICQKN